MSSRVYILLLLCLLFSVGDSVKKKNKEKGAMDSQNEESENESPERKEKNATKRTSSTERTSPELPIVARIDQPLRLAEQLKTVDYQNISLEPGEDSVGTPDPTILDSDPDTTPRLVIDVPEEKKNETTPKAPVVKPTKIPVFKTGEGKGKAGPRTKSPKPIQPKTQKDPRTVRDQPKVAPSVSSPPRPPLNDRIQSIIEAEHQVEKEKAKAAREQKEARKQMPPQIKDKPENARERSRTRARDQSNRSRRAQWSGGRARSATRKAEMAEEERYYARRREFGWDWESNTVATGQPYVASRNTFSQPVSRTVTAAQVTPTQAEIPVVPPITTSGVPLPTRVRDDQQGSGKLADNASSTPRHVLKDPEAKGSMKVSIRGNASTEEHLKFWLKRAELEQELVDLERDSEEQDRQEAQQRGSRQTSRQSSRRSSRSGGKDQPRSGDSRPRSRSGDRRSRSGARRPESGSSRRSGMDENLPEVDDHPQDPAAGEHLSGNGSDTRQGRAIGRHQADERCSESESSRSRSQDRRGGDGRKRGREGGDSKNSTQGDPKRRSKKNDQ